METGGVELAHSTEHTGLTTDYRGGSRPDQARNTRCSKPHIHRQITQGLGLLREGRGPQRSGAQPPALRASAICRHDPSSAVAAEFRTPPQYLVDGLM